VFFHGSDHEEQSVCRDTFQSSSAQLFPSFWTAEKVRWIVLQKRVEFPFTLTSIYDLRWSKVKNETHFASDSPFRFLILGCGAFTVQNMNSDFDSIKNAKAPQRIRTQGTANLV
jgi:hypothetical protein